MNSRQDPSDIPNMVDFGFAFDNSHSFTMPRRVYDHQHGIYPMRYTEPWGWWRSFGDNSTEPSYDEKIAALMDDYNNGTGMWRGVVTTKFAAEAVLNSAPYDKNGTQCLDETSLWNNWGSWQQNYPANPDPDIPSPNRYDISHENYIQLNVSSIRVWNWTIASNCSINNTAYNGNYSGKIEILGTSNVTSGHITASHVNVAPSTEYNFTVWGKTLNCGGMYPPYVRVAEHYINGTFITQKNLNFGFGTTDWTEKTTTFTTTADTVYIRVYANIHNGYGTFWFDDVKLNESGNDTNLVETAGFESTYDSNDYPCSGLHIDSISTTSRWARIENYRRSHWEYIDHPLVFSYDTKQPVLLGTLSHYDYLASSHNNMTSMNRFLNANIFTYAYSFYGHLIDVFGGETHWLVDDDDIASLCRTMSYQKTNRNILHWDRYGKDSITQEEVETYINNNVFYGMFPSIGITSSEEIYGSNRYWNNATLYERDRKLFKKYIPIIKNISAAGWEPIPYTICDNPNIKFERYGHSIEDLYFTVGNSGSEVESGVLTSDLSKLSFGGNSVEVRELITDTTHKQDIEDGKVLIAISELHPNETIVYKISP